ncbi:MAG: energy transducer TonB [Bryobacteraceae bacterium]
MLLLLFMLRFSGNVSNIPAAVQHFTLLAPVPEMRPPAPKTQAPRPERYRPVPPAHVNVPSVPVIPITLKPIIVAPAIEIPKPTLPEISKLPVTLAVIKVNSFPEAKPAAPLPAPKPVVKAAGFQSAETSATGPARTLAPVGAFDAASTSTGSAPARSATANTGAAGFSDASAGSSSGAHKGSVTSGTFGDTTVDKGAAPKQRSAVVTSTPVEILSKPKPVYTDEARAKKIEGEVLLEMQFSASGEARVLRVVRGLGYGLDETALTAARGIRFHPATRDGGAVDSAAIVHIVFQLAN